MSLYNSHKDILDKAIKANKDRGFWAAYPEHPKAYGEEAPTQGEQSFNAILNAPFNRLKQEGSNGEVGDEVSPFTGESLGIKYPSFDTETLIEHASSAWSAWKNASAEERAGVLIETLDRVKERFFEIAYATMHTSGQSYMMSFQASGPHSNDRALEAIAMGFEELTRFNRNTVWDKPMGKFNVVLNKEFKAIPKGISLVIGCSTFPVWNSVPGIYASLMTGNPVIVKPHPRSVLPIAIVVEEIQNVMIENGYDAHLCQLAADSLDNQITKTLAEHIDVKLIDYTGGSAFGDYVESLNKKVFTEKAGVNPVIIDSVVDLDKVLGNLAFSISLYSGQMCTAPQNFFIPEAGVQTADGIVTFDEVVDRFAGHIKGLVDNPKMGPGTLAAIQNNATLERVEGAASIGAEVKLSSNHIDNPEFNKARTASPTLLQMNSSDVAVFEKEFFGPIAIVIKTANTEESISLARDLTSRHGALSCAAYTTDDGVKAKIADAMNSVFVPVSFNLTGFIWVNQHAAFSDFHGTGGNPAGNASFTNPAFLNDRFVWVGNREVASV